MAGRERADVHRALRIDAHALQRFTMRTGDTIKGTVTVKADEPAIEEMIDAGSS